VLCGIMQPLVDLPVLFQSDERHAARRPLSKARILSSPHNQWYSERMASRVSAGLLMYRFRGGDLQVFLAHPGGPLFRNKDEGHWTIPKGEPPENESLLNAATREFEEETGIKPHGQYLELGAIRQKGGKTVHAWAFEGDYDESLEIRSNTFEMQWPPGSGNICAFPEIDRASFFLLPEARRKLKEAQWPLVERLITLLETTARKE
jgi:predicted NUDIX family NTP pyrophosphohydrolase